jgi:hypothetical protein
MEVNSYGLDGKIIANEEDFDIDELLNAANYIYVD